MRESGVRLFDEVSMIDYSIIKDYQSVILKIRIYEKGVKQNWLVNKKLLPGSLVALSYDDFKTITLCKVAERNNKRMNETSKKFQFIEIGVEVVISDLIGFID